MFIRKEDTGPPVVLGQSDHHAQTSAPGIFSFILFFYNCNNFMHTIVTFKVFSYPRTGLQITVVKCGNPLGL